VRRILSDVELVVHLASAPKVRGGDTALVERIAEALGLAASRIRKVVVCDNQHRGSELSFVVVDQPGDANQSAGSRAQQLMLRHARGEEPLVVGAQVYNVTVKDEGYADVLRSLDDPEGAELESRAPAGEEPGFDPVEVGAFVEGGDAAGFTLEEAFGANMEGSSEGGGFTQEPLLVRDLVSRGARLDDARFAVEASGGVSLEAAIALLRNTASQSPRGGASPADSPTSQAIAASMRELEANEGRQQANAGTENEDEDEAWAAAMELSLNNLHIAGPPGGASEGQLRGDANSNDSQGGRAPPPPGHHTITEGSHARRDRNLDDDEALAEAMKQSLRGQGPDTREEMARKIVETLGVSHEQAMMAVEATGGQSIEAAIELCF